MEIAEVLEKIGLNQKEASVYLALLELGTAAVQSIATKAGIKRPTTYLVLDNLQAKGLVSIVPRARKALYVAESPEHLIADLARKEDLVKRLLPNLLAVYNARKEKPQVQLFSGKEGVRQIYQQIFAANNLSFFGTSREISKIDPDLNKEFLSRIKEQEIRVCDLFTRSEEDLAYAQEATKGANYQARFLPENMEFLTDSALFGDKIVFFSFRPQIFSVMITSREISQSLKILYELAWQEAEPLQKLSK